MESLWGAWTSRATLVLSLLLAGCAAAPSLPSGIPLQHTLVVPLGSEPHVQLEEAGWTGRSARSGGLLGAGVGLGLGGLVCIGTGPLAPLCLGTVVPLTTAVGAIGGAAAGAAQGRSSPGAEDKHALLQREWLALADRAPLFQALQRQLQRATPARSEPDPGAEVKVAPWRFQVGYATLGTVGSGVDKPFLLQATARLVVWRPQGDRPVVERLYMAQSAERLTTVQWSADNALVLRRTLDQIGIELTQQIADDLAHADPR